MDQKNIKSKKGFTIIELLVVIVIIGILAAITMVSYSGVTGKAKDSSAKTQAYAVRDAAETYASQDSNGYYPSTTGNFSTTFASGLKISLAASVFGAIDANNPQIIEYQACSDNAANLAAGKYTGYKITYYQSSGTNGTISNGNTSNCNTRL